jgi:hypothetical protein
MPSFSYSTVINDHFLEAFPDSAVLVDKNRDKLKVGIIFIVFTQLYDLFFCFY